MPPPTNATNGFTRFDPIVKHAESDISTISLGEEVTLTDYTQTGKITLFEFYGDKCLACADFAPKLRKFLGAHPEIILRKINIGDGESDVVRQHSITVTPTIIAIDDSGRELIRQDGATLHALNFLVK